MIIALKEGLVILVGVVIGIAIFSVLRKKYKEQETEKITEEKRIEKQKKYEDLLSSQAYVETLNVDELTAWYTEQNKQYDEKVKMLIVSPSEEMMVGLGFNKGTALNQETNILQVICDKEVDKILKIRLVSFEHIESNLQALLLENDGMIVVSE